MAECERQAIPAGLGVASCRALLLCLPVAGLLAACNPLPYAKLATDDLDNSVSVLTEEECDLQNIFRGRSYCQERIVVRDDPPVYCFRTLGVPTCYASDDPYAIARRTGGRIPAPMALGDAVPGAEEMGPGLSVQYMDGMAAPGGEAELRAVARDISTAEPGMAVQPLPVVPVEMQSLPPKSTLRSPGD